MRRLLACGTALAALLLAPFSPASAAAPPAVDDAVASGRAGRAAIDFWFNQYGYSPTMELPAGQHWYSLSADCDGGGSVGGQLYHSALGVDSKVGSAFVIRCGGSTDVNYRLRGGLYYFYFLSGVDNTRITG
ncbi:hypothetical protein [Streptomyces stackebrandtii]|uniref:hypothetical protein n=1 Tax=Streptomyces stackebrandtii TaxID=3051177 RepID=UPI0028DB5365|nr:hypothetical protein [Streptomyces sp. DSM 40976]